jgi:uncharacterized protein (UPF0333 family)
VAKTTKTNRKTTGLNLKITKISNQIIIKRNIPKPGFCYVVPEIA